MDIGTETEDEVEGKSIVAPMGMVPRQSSTLGSIPFRSIYVSIENLNIWYFLPPQAMELLGLVMHMNPQSRHLAQGCLMEPEDSQWGVVDLQIQIKVSKAIWWKNYL